MLREKRIVEYKLVSGTHARIITEEVNKLLMQGWELYFGPCGNEYITQALAKYQTPQIRKRKIQ